MPETTKKTQAHDKTSAEERPAHHSSSAGVAAGDTVKIHYTGSFEDGTVFDSSQGRDPIEFVVGEGKVIKGFDSAVLGMKKGDHKEVKISPEDAYGMTDDTLVRAFPRSRLPADPEPKKGMILSLKSPDGRTILAKIDRIEGEEVWIDFNHPLAGKTLHFKMELVGLTRA